MSKKILLDLDDNDVAKVKMIQSHLSTRTVTETFRRIIRDYPLALKDYEQHHIDKLAEREASIAESEAEQARSKAWRERVVAAEKRATDKNTEDQAMLLVAIDRVEVENRTSKQPNPALEAELRAMVARFKAMPEPIPRFRTMIYFRDGSFTDLSADK